MGDIGRRAHLPAVLRHRDVELTHVIDTDRTKLDSVQGQLPTTTIRTTEFEQALSDGVDAVILATPPWQTTQLAVAALEHGAYVLAEKPIAPSLDAADPLARLQPEIVERLQIGLTYRHHEAMERMRDLVAEGWFGSPIVARVAAYDERLDPASEPEHYKRILEMLRFGSPMVHDGAHLCDWINFVLAANPIDVAARAVRTAEEFARPNFESASLEYADGSVAFIEIGWLFPQLPPSYMCILGPQGLALLELSTFSLTLESGGARDVIQPTVDRTTHSFARQLDRFLACCRTRTPALPGLSEAIASLALCERIVAACASSDAYASREKPL